MSTRSPAALGGSRTGRCGRPDRARCGVHARDGDDRLRPDVLGVGAAVPPRLDPAGAARPVRLPAGTPGCGPGAGQLAGPDPRRRAHRPARGATNVPGHGASDRPARALPRALRPLAHRLPARWLLSRVRRDDVRHRHPVRQLVVPARAARPGAGHLAAVLPLRGRIRRVRGVQRLPAHLPDGRLPPRQDRRRAAHRGLRRTRHRDATGRWLAERPPAPGARAAPSVCPPPACSATCSPTSWAPCCGLVIAFGSVAAYATVVAFQPLLPVATIAFLGIAAALGAGTGAVFALVARMVAAERVSAVTGVVGAAGGLGGFFPPLVMGLVYGTLGGYGVGFALLAITAAGAARSRATIVKRRVRLALQPA